MKIRKLIRFANSESPGKMQFVMIEMLFRGVTIIVCDPENI